MEPLLPMKESLKTCGATSSNKELPILSTWGIQYGTELMCYNLTRDEAEKLVKGHRKWSITPVMVKMVPR